MDELLRNECKYLKCYKDISYKQIADQLGIKQDSFYNWLKGYYSFSYKRRVQLQYIISALKEQ